MQHYLTSLYSEYNCPYAEVIAVASVVIAILLTSLIVHLFIHKLVYRTLDRISDKQQTKIFSLLLKYKTLRYLALTLQGCLLYILSQLWFSEGEFVASVIRIIGHISVLVFATLAFFSILDIIMNICQRKGISTRLPIRGLIQGVKVVLTIFIAIIIVSVLIDKSPTLLISGLGAMTAILMLVFKDPLLGLVAGIQLSANNMLNVGDWLEMPKYGADGDVIDITLTTVKVQNWDKTIVTIPAYALISDSFKNWRGMVESGGRRIKRSINIDTTSVRFLNREDCDRLQKAQLLAPYIQQKQTELAQYNDNRDADLSLLINGRRLTNVGTFRAYLEFYLRANPNIHQEMTLMVRQLAPTELGLPIEIYAFTNTTRWVDYENIQADIFDHLFAVISEFGLRIHQTPTGYDVRSVAQVFVAREDQNSE